MHKEINGTMISFLDENNNEIMYIDFPNDECIWYFDNSDEIEITEDMDLYNPLKNIMSENYLFIEKEPLKSYKDNNKLVWYSDCYYNPNSEMSKSNVSFLTINYIDNKFKLKCTKPIYNIIKRRKQYHVIAFSPLGNGRSTINLDTNTSLQDDFVKMVYLELLNKEKVKSK